MKLLNGKKIATEILSELKEKISRLTEKPGLAVILIGNDPASHLYVSLKEKACLKVGIKFEKFLFPDLASENEIIKKINELNLRKDINGILVQLPLPQQNANKIIAAINPNKDIDGFHTENLRRLEAREPGLISPVVLGVMRLINETQESLENKKVALVMSEIFARPFRTILQQTGATVEIILPEDIALKEKTKNSDVLITAVGKPHLITEEMIKPQAIVIDIGTTRVNQKIVGDVNIDPQNSSAGWLTPVPGGVGPMTVALLMENVFQATKNQRPKIV